jgi:hypothetical protein
MSFLHYNFRFTPLHLHCPSLCFCIGYISVDCCTTTCTPMDGCTFGSTMFSSPASVYIVCVSTKCCSTTSSSSNSSMNIRSTYVAPSHVCSLTCQCLFILHKNSTIDVPIISMSWIIICANYNFSLYTFPSTHFEDDDESMTTS